MSRWARARDANEGQIVRALEQAGASVQRLDVIDLLVGHGGDNFLLEVKNPEAKLTSSALHVDEVTIGGVFEGMPRTLRRNQAEWIVAWKGRRPVVVEYPHDALAVIGADTKLCTCADCVADGVLP